MSTSQGNDRIHQLLCAWILGEASEAEAREVEQALEASPELRAERERIAATIGTVQAAYAGGEHLSEDAMARLLAAAEHGPRPIGRLLSGPGAWLRSPMLKAAVVVVLVGGTALLFQSPPRPAVGDSVATAPASGSSRVAPASVVDGRLSDAPGAPMAEARREKEAPDDALGYSGAVEAERTGQRPEEALRRMRGLGYAGDDGEATVGLVEQAAETTVPAQPAAGEVRLAIEPKDEKAGKMAGSDDFYLGRGRGQARPDGSAQAAPTGERLALGDVAGGEANGAYRGPGDTRPPGAASGPANPGPAGPSTPGSALRQPRADAGGAALPEAAPPARAGAGGGGGRGLDSEGVLAGLEALGYTGGSGDAEAEVTEEEGQFARFSGAEEVDRDGQDALERSILRYEYKAGRDLRRRLSSDELDRLADLLARQRYEQCRRRPRETPRDMFFRYWGDNPFEDASRDAQSTFSVDVDTASYALARRYLNENHLPTKAQVRTEEFLNYFDPDLPAPAEGTFAVHTELAPSLFGGRTERWTLRVGLRGKEVPREERPPLALTFVIDTSGSMRENQRLELVKHAVRLLVSQLDERDRIAVVAYSNEARLILPMTPANQRGVIEAAIHPLAPSGSTNAEAGLQLGYQLARTALESGVQNRVVFLSDGVANVGQTDQDRINAQVGSCRQQGIYLNTIGVGMNNHNDVFLEQLADKGDGICDYVDDASAARRAIVERFTSAFVPIASDVKVQVEFDPSQVARYRLLGYENRAVADRDFRNDAVDAGEVGSGHQVVALYELELAPKPAETLAKRKQLEELGYATEEAPPLATVRVRWKAPKGAGQDPLEVDVSELEQPVQAADGVASFAATSPGYRRSVLVAQFAEFLRRSVHAQGDSFEVLEQETARLANELGDPEFDEFRGLVMKAIGLGLPVELMRDDLELTLDQYRRYLYMRAQLEDLERRDEIDKLRQMNDELERRIRDLIRQDLQDRNG